MTPAEGMLYATTRILTVQNGKQSGSGTGFFYSIKFDDGRSTVLLISNRHVFKGCDGIIITLPLKNENESEIPTADTYTWNIEFMGKPIGHPDDNIDLAAVSISGLRPVTGDSNRRPFYRTINRESIPSRSDWAAFDAIEEVTMVGCPNGLFDEFNNLPIVRRGVTATHPGKSYKGRDEFMVDIACFPGSSGSPVFMLNAGATFSRTTQSYSIGGNVRMFFLGVLYAGPTINQAGELVLTKTPSFSIATMMHLGMIIKSTQLIAFDDLARNHLASGLALNEDGGTAKS